MTDWETISKGAIEFLESTQTAKITITSTVQGPSCSSNGYNACSTSGCTAEMDASCAYHELGHVIGFQHEHQRWDRARYVEDCLKTQTSCNSGIYQPETCVPGNDNGAFATCNDFTQPGMFGPFDYKSTMLYSAVHPDITRYDGTPLIPPCTCPPTAPMPPQCKVGTDCTGTNCTAPPGNSGWWLCPTCKSCGKGQPYGLPTPQDGAAIVELYSNWWAPFIRTTTQAQTGAWYDNHLVAGGSIVIVGNPAVQSYDTGDLSIFVLGSDKHIYRKSYADNGHGGYGWSDWSDLGGTLGSSPGVVSWASGRIDLVARVCSGSGSGCVASGNQINIRTFSGGAWSTWQSLGGLPSRSTIASAPAITSRGANLLDVFVRGSDNKLWVKSCSANCKGNAGTWTAWTSPFGAETFKGAPAVVAYQTSNVSIYVHGMDDGLYFNSYNGGQAGTGWTQLLGAGSLGWNASTSCPDCYSPAVGARSPNTIDIMFRGVGDLAWFGDASGAFSALGGVLVSSPALVTRARSTDVIDVIGIMNEETDSGVFTPAAWWKHYPNLNTFVINDSALSYVPMWNSTSTDSSYVQSDAHFSNAAGNLVKYEFSGTAVKLLGDRAANHGFGDVTIDGLYEGRFDAYFNYATGGTKALWQKDGLTSGWHTIQVTVAGAHDSAASDNYITMDAIQYWASSRLPLFTTQANDSAATYTGSWISGAVDSTFVNGDAHWSNVAGSSWSYSFSGGSVQILSDRHPNHGYADVAIDGVYRGRYDGYYDFGTGGKQVVWEISGLTVGSHVVKVTVVGSHNASATDSYVVLDALNYQ